MRAPSSPTAFQGKSRITNMTHRALRNPGPWSPLRGISPCLSWRSMPPLSRVTAPITGPLPRPGMPTPGI